jgi:phosphomannomutase
MPINFGTDGWRAVISDTFTFANLRMVTQAIADAVASATWNNGDNINPPPDPSRMVVGFDTRFLSDRYAQDVSRVLAANGFTVHLGQSDGPHPGLFLRNPQFKRDGRRHDHCFPQCSPLQRREVEIHPWKFSLSRTVAPRRSVPE